MPTPLLVDNSEAPYRPTESISYAQGRRPRMSMASELADFFANAPPPSDSDIHRKAASEDTQCNRTEAWKGFDRTYAASKMIQQILGFRGTEPYATPPEMPRGLEEAFLKGVGGLRVTEEVRSAAHFEMGLGKSRTGLDDIPEERESPVREDRGDRGEGEDGLLYDDFATCTTLANSDSSHSGSLANWVAARSEAGDNESLRDGGGTGAEVTSQLSSILTPLFPSPRVDAKASGLRSVWNGSIADDYTPVVAIPGSICHGVPARLRGSHEATIVPEISIESPSPNKNPLPRKRTHSTSSQRQPGSPFARARTDHTAGLPILPEEADMLWKFHFPGNTRGLLTILLGWSYAMQSFSNRLPAPQLFPPPHPAFPYTANRPVFRPLLSVAFYDTSLQPHKEVRFLGPGDAAKMIYCEVDTFRCRDDLYHAEGQIQMLRRTMGLAHQTTRCHIPLQQRAATGEGRWCYILIQDHASSVHETAPHLMLAFPISAITNQSLGLYTLLLDDHTPLTNGNTPYEPCKRAGSSEDPMSSPNYADRLRQTLRSASSLELPRVDGAGVDGAGTYGVEAAEGTQMLHRVVLKMEKAGRSPLIEGYRVDVGKFRGWIDAVGRGEGKVIMWKERG